MTEQPTALRLADALADYTGCTLAQMDQAASELRRLHSQRDALLEALKLAWPIIETQQYVQDCSYGKNFVQTKADRARNIYAKARAAIKAVEEGA